MWDISWRRSGFDGIITLHRKYLHRKTERGGDFMQRYLLEHFLREGHKGLINDVEVIIINKTDPSDPTRKKELWRTKLKTLVPFGVNVKEGLLMSSLK